MGISLRNAEAACLEVLRHPLACIIIGCKAAPQPDDCIDQERNNCLEHLKKELDK